LIEENTSLSRKATLLLGEVLRLANRILPLQYAAQLQSLPQFFHGTTAFGDADQRNFALTALSSIDSLNRNQVRARQSAPRERAGSIPDIRDPVQRGQRSVNASKLRANMSIEDKQFQQMVVDSGVRPSVAQFLVELTIRYSLAGITLSGTMTSSWSC
jgi:rapamycin-insensitive companion of mTOR